MSGRTFVVGDIHGDLGALELLLARLPALDAKDTLVFIGDYLDRGPQSAAVVRLLRLDLPKRTPAAIVALRGNHEDAWLKAIDGGNPGFLLPAGNGCLATMRSFQGLPPPQRGEFPSTPQDTAALFAGSFFPPEVVAWMRGLAYFHEDQHAIYVHGGLPPADGRFAHPSEYTDPAVLVWCRSKEFFTGYRGKRVVFGHTPVEHLPQQLSTHTPADAKDMYLAEDVIGVDTGCGRGGFLTAVELPSLTVYETRA